MFIPTLNILVSNKSNLGYKIVPSLTCRHLHADHSGTQNSDKGYMYFQNELSGGALAVTEGSPSGVWISQTHNELCKSPVLAGILINGFFILST